MFKKFLILILCVLSILATCEAQSNYNTKERTEFYGYRSNKTSSRTSSYNYNTNSTYQNGYTRQDGTVVRGHYKTQSNGTNVDNYSTSGNINPYTGKAGTRAKDYSQEAYNYGAGQTVQTGPRGGQYYVNSNGNKTYVPKRR